MLPLIIPLISQIFDKIFPDQERANVAKLKLLEMMQKGDLAYLESAAKIITAEAKSESWLSNSWRPIAMLFFLGLIGSYWFGYAPPNVTEKIIMELFTLVKIGLGGYIVGRSAEKVAKVWKEK